MADGFSDVDALQAAQKDKERDCVYKARGAKGKGDSSAAPLERKRKRQRYVDGESYDSRDRRKLGVALRVKGRRDDSVGRDKEQARDMEGKGAQSERDRVFVKALCLVNKLDYFLSCDERVKCYRNCYQGDDFYRPRQHRIVFFPAPALGVGRKVRQYNRSD